MVCCGETGIFLKLEIQTGKVLMCDTKHQKALGATAACVVHVIEMTSRCGQRVQPSSTGNLTKDKYYGDIWFALVKAAEECYVHGVDFVSPVKTAM